MKFLCIACDQAMRLAGTAGPDAGSLTVTFSCPTCGHRIAMLTNPWETQMVRTLAMDGEDKPMLVNRLFQGTEGKVQAHYLG